MSTKDTQNEEPDFIYHYTTISGLKGIIENKNIWATNINHLNDWKEFKEFVNPFLEKFKKSIKIKSILKNIFDKNSRNIYVCSFSQKNDDLSQWRAYCPHANGFSLGFNYSKLKGILPPGELHKCKYNKKDQEEEIGNIIDRNIKSNNIDSNDMNRIIDELTNMAPYYKNEKFKDEEEWRLVISVDNKEIKFREGKTMIIPYIEIDLVANKDGNLPIENICIGPTPYMTESELSLDILLKQNKLSDVTIKRSEVPYRTL